jgi:hypothetical protein
MGDGRVIATYGLNTNSPDVVIQTGATPLGPFQPAKKYGKRPKYIMELIFILNNAKAHPHLAKPGEFLISYNVNSFNFIENITKHPYHCKIKIYNRKFKKTTNNLKNQQTKHKYFNFKSFNYLI